MKKQKELKVKYIKGYRMEHGVKYPVYDYINTITSHTKRYHNCLYLLAGLNGCARDLLDYLTENMDKDNLVTNSRQYRENFISTIKHLTSNLVDDNNIPIDPTIYKDDTVNKAFQRLAESRIPINNTKEQSLIIPIGRGTYMVNPMFFSKNNDDRREHIIRLVFEKNKDTKIILE